MVGKSVERHPQLGAFHALETLLLAQDEGLGLPAIAVSSSAGADDSCRHDDLPCVTHCVFGDMIEQSDHVAGDLRFTHTARFE